MLHERKFTRIRENVFEHLTLCTAYGGNTVNGRIQLGRCYRGKKVGWEFDGPDFKF